MSQAVNQVKWCLDHARKQLAEGRKHRGIVEVKPNLDSAKNHLEKAEHDFKSVLFLAKSGFSD